MAIDFVVLDLAIDFEEVDEQITTLETSVNMKVCLEIVNGSTQGELEITLATVSGDSASCETLELGIWSQKVNH